MVETDKMDPSIWYYQLISDIIVFDHKCQGLSEDMSDKMSSENRAES